MYIHTYVHNIRMVHTYILLPDTILSYKYVAIKLAITATHTLTMITTIITIIAVFDDPPPPGVGAKI